MCAIQAENQQQLVTTLGEDFRTFINQMEDRDELVTIRNAARSAAAQAIGNLLGYRSAGGNAAAVLTRLNKEWNDGENTLEEAEGRLCWVEAEVADEPNPCCRGGSCGMCC